MAKEWQHDGDVNPIDWGGMFARFDERGDIEYIGIIGESEIGEGEGILYHGTIVDPKEYMNEKCIKLATEELGCTAEEFLEQPAVFANELVNGYGCGFFEFSPTNINGQGAYSMNMDDFKATSREIALFLKEAGVPETYWESKLA